jgi:mannose-6-phosphate isomerase-like protein (cupin superfamily)
MDTINLAHKFSLFSEHWSPRIIAELNDNYIKVVKVQGEFEWHKHDHEDELFLVVKGHLTIKLRDPLTGASSELHIGEGELAVIPKGVEHLPVAEEEVHILLMEPKTTVNTGEVRDERTVDPGWI